MVGLELLFSFAKKGFGEVFWRRGESTGGVGGNDCFFFSMIDGAGLGDGLGSGGFFFFSWGVSASWATMISAVLRQAAALLFSFLIHVRFLV